MMNQKLNFQQIAPLLFGLILVAAIVVAAGTVGNLPAIRVAPRLSGNLAGAADVDTFDYEQAADNLAYRWNAMARFYEANGLLTRDNFDYEQAADNLAYRWNAMARFYEANGLLARDDFNYEQAADNLAYRWNAMARAYERMGLLNER